MAERDPIDLLRDQLNSVDTLTALHIEDEAFQRWHTETKAILEKIFTQKSIHCQNFLALRFHEISIKAFASREIDRINTARFKRDLENAKNILHGAIKELTLDRTFFKKIQTTPETVEASLQGEYFISTEIQEPEMIRSIESAFKGSGLTPVHGFKPGEVSLQRLIDRIKRARFGIFAIPSPGMDTFIEVGIALGLGKEVTLLLRKGSSLPETMKEIEQIEYENLSELTEKLRKKLNI